MPTRRQPNSISARQAGGSSTGCWDRLPALAYPSGRRHTWETCLQFVGAHILSVGQFERGDIERIFAVADDLRPYATRARITRVLQGAILSNMFFEPSTRTRISFGSAFNLLGGEVRETTEVKSSSLAKGESLHDTARVLSGYSDVIVMRHPEAGSVAEFAQASRVPVINAGDGPNEHPSQALLDLYTIKQEMAGRGQGIDGLRIALIGDLKYGRAVHSLCKLVGRYDNIAYHLVSPPELEIPAAIADELRAKGHRVRSFHQLRGGHSRCRHSLRHPYPGRAISESGGGGPVPGPVPPEPGDLYGTLPAQYRHHASPAPGFPECGSGAGCRPGREPESRDFPADRQRRHRQDGAVLIGTRRCRRGAQPCPARDLVYGETDTALSLSHPRWQDMPLPCMDSIVDQPVFQSFRPVQFNMMPALGVRVGLPRPQRFRRSAPAFRRPFGHPGHGRGPGSRRSLVAPASSQVSGGAAPGFFGAKVRHRELAHIGLTVGLHLHAKCRRRPIDEVDATHARRVAPWGDGGANPPLFGAKLVKLPFFVKRPGLLADLAVAPCWGLQ